MFAQGECPLQGEGELDATDTKGIIKKGASSVWVQMMSLGLQIIIEHKAI